MWATLCLSLAAVAADVPVRSEYLLELWSVPVGTVQLEWSANAGTYSYRSAHFVPERGAVRRRVSSETHRVRRDGRLVGEGRFLESLWLWRKPLGVGCVRGVAELTRRMGELCATSVTDEVVEGTALEVPFRARYVHGVLAELILPDARFVRLERGSPNLAPGDFLLRGLPIKGAGQTLRIEPEAASAQATSPSSNAVPESVLTASLEELGTAPGTCLEQARALLRKLKAQGHAGLLVHGVFVERDTAWPHAWVRVQARTGPRDVDPALGVPVRPKSHLAIWAGDMAEPSSAAGELWLDLLAGRRRIVRR